MQAFDLKIDKQFLDDIALLKAENPKLAAKIWELVSDILHNPSNPLQGRGKPEPLLGNMSGYFSRRVNDKHRLIYRFNHATSVLYLVSCYGHYDDK